MKKKNPMEIVADITAHIRDLGDSNDEWYAGIAADPPAWLFRRHRVRREDTDAWIVRKAANEATARKAEKWLLKDGSGEAPGGGDESTRFVYAHKIASYTSEQ